MLVPIAILQLFFLIIALAISGVGSLIFLILFGLIIIYEVSYLLHRLRSPWRRLHFPLMVRYHKLVGARAALAESSQIEFDRESALFTLVKSVYPDWNENEIRLLIESAEKKRTTYADRDIFVELYKNKYPSIDQDEIEEIVHKIENEFSDPEQKPYYVRYIIGEIVSREFGEKERSKYIRSLFTGVAF